MSNIISQTRGVEMMPMTPEQTRAMLFCTFVSVSYVASLYLIPSEIRKLPRDNPSHIRYRMLYSTASTLQSMMLLYYLSRPDNSYVNIPGVSYFESIGLKLDNMVPSILISCVLMSTFYLGPLVVSIIMIIVCVSYDVLPSGELKAKESKYSIATELYKQAYEYYRSIMNTMRDECGFLFITRNLIFAPITEEIAFRSMMIPVLYATFTTITDKYGGNLHSNSSTEFNMTPIQIALLSPAYFALAHIHHIVEKTRGGTPLKVAVLQVTLQLTYTSIFGVIAALIFMRTYSITGPILSHFICNVCGLPDIDFMKPPRSRYASQTSCLYSFRYLLLFLHALGLVLFSCVLFPLTESQAKHSPLYH